MFDHGCRNSRRDFDMVCRRVAFSCVQMLKCMFVVPTLSHTSFRGCEINASPHEVYMHITLKTYGMN